MKIFHLFFAVLIFDACYGQQKICGCKTDSSKDGTADCSTKYLKNGTKLYYQFNCDSVWLTLESRNGRKRIIYSNDVFMEYTYRLGYQLAREYDNYLLFRSGCPANGPCNFILIDKRSGKKVKEFGELIYDHETNRFYKFVMYFSNDQLNSLTIYYIDTKKKYHIPVDASRFNNIVPEYTFNSIFIKKRMLFLNYTYYDKHDKSLPGKVAINLSKCHG